MGAESPHILGRDRTRGLSGRDNRLVVGGSLDRAAGLTVARSSGGVRRLEVRRFSQPQGRLALHLSRPVR